MADLAERFFSDDKQYCKVVHFLRGADPPCNPFDLLVPFTASMGPEDCSGFTSGLHEYFDHKGVYSNITNVPHEFLDHARFESLRCGAQSTIDWNEDPSKWRMTTCQTTLFAT